MNRSQPAVKPNYKTALALYYLTILLWVIGSFAAGWRMWAFNFGTFLTEGIAVLFLIVVVLAPWIIDSILHGDDISGRSLRTYWLSTFSLTLVLSLLFVLFRTRTHFLGDGYTAISLLAADHPLLKMREMGESYAHLWVKNLFGAGKSAAITSFQVISIGSGVVSTVLCFWAGNRLYGRTIKGILFAFLILSAGYAMLFFGYTENYSLFTLGVVAFVLSGILATRNHLPKWLPLLPALIAAVMHTIGVVFIPAALFVALKDTPPGRFFARNRTRLVLLITALIVIICLAAIWYYQSNRFVRFSILTLTANEFTIGGYTLFSPQHLIDIVNLLFLLVPSLLSAIWLFLTNFPRIRGSFTYQFSGLAFVSALVAVLLFDPKLGMPRDWDLFSFVGVPLAAAVAVLVLETKSTRQKQIVALLLTLNLAVLFSRLAIVDTESSAIAQFSSYLDLDIGKSRPGSYILFKYYLEKGDNSAADSLHELWKDRYPEMYIMDTVNIDMKQGDYVSAAEKLERILKLTPTNHDALANLGTCYTFLGKYDTALVLLNLAVGHNPYDVGAWTNLGTIYYHKMDYKEAEKAWLNAYDLDSLAFAAPANLAMLYRKTGHRDKCLNYLKKAASTKGAPPSIYARMAEFYLDVQDYKRAAALYRFGLQHGLDTTVVKEARTKYQPLDSVMSGS